MHVEKNRNLSNRLKNLKKSKKIAKTLAKNGNLQYNFSILNSNNN
jgi:hypothetical protein